MEKTKREPPTTLVGRPFALGVFAAVIAVWLLVSFGPLYVFGMPLKPNEFGDTFGKGAGPRL